MPVQGFCPERPPTRQNREPNSPETFLLPRARGPSSFVASSRRRQANVIRTTIPQWYTVDVVRARLRRKDMLALSRNQIFKPGTLKKVGVRLVVRCPMLISRLPLFGSSALAVAILKL